MGVARCVSLTARRAMFMFVLGVRGYVGGERMLLFGFSHSRIGRYGSIAVSHDRLLSTHSWLSQKSAIGQ
jgi:hypothetical protein